MIKVVEDSELDLHFPAPATDGVDENPTGFDIPDEEDNQVVEMGNINTKVLWLDGDDDNTNRNQDSLLDDTSIFCNDFPPLPDINCMLSSLSTPAVSKQPTAASSAGSTSSSVNMMNSEISTLPRFENGGEDGAKSTTAMSSTASVDIQPPSNQDCIEEVMVNQQYDDLIDCNEMWDPSSIFQTENPEGQQAAEKAQTPSQEEESNGFTRFLQSNSELSALFFEWLKQNRHHVSAEDMRSIKLKQSTVENAINCLGTNQEGKTQLLKLILQWVEQHKLRKKRAASQNPNPNLMYNPMSPDTNACFSPASPWPPKPIHPMGRYGGDLYSCPCPSPMTCQVVSRVPYQSSAEYQGVDHARPWVTMPTVQPQLNHYPNNGNVMNYQPTVFGNPYNTSGEKLMRLGQSATKEARKKRMARQRKMNSYKHRHGSNSNQHVHCGEDGDSSDSPEGRDVAAGNGPISQTKAAFDRRQQQIWKSEKNLKFLLQKVLKQSDVGNLGRIVLPKKEAESHLPELETRDGITIPMEDIGTSRVWNMRYRFWPNNKSRMYILENTGDFVSLNGLEEGDFIVLYLNTKCGKFMIRGVKVREAGTKTADKPPTKQNVTGNSSSIAPIKKALQLSKKPQDEKAKEKRK